jgi:endonuclease/exonuclease/phosphatase family metal-dependent hydrolase
MEKREGNRHALIVRVDCGSGGVLTIANVHLEVFGTAHCRRVQMKFLLSRLPAGPAIVTGDFNTNTFSRGSAFQISRSLALLTVTDVRSRVLHPWRYEPLFKDLSASGFSWQTFNDEHPTCSVDLTSLDDRVPAFVRKFILSRHSFLPLRLDFICCRGLKPVTPGHTITDLPCQPSDHLPITCDLTL